MSEPVLFSMQRLPECRPLCRSPACSRTQGFTLTELIAVMIILGILASVALPRFFNRSDFDAFGYMQQTKQSLRFAQKMAIAKRRLICVSTASNTLTLRFASAYGASVCDQNVVDPSTGSTFSQAAPTGIAITSLAFNYDPLGRPSFSATQTLNVTGGATTQSFTVEAETGYVP